MENRTARIEKPWGYELIFAQTQEYIGKVIVVRKGERLSLQYHSIKEETLYLNRGVARLTLGERTLTLRPGATIHIRPKVNHRLEALEECEIFEVSTCQLDDVVRVEDDYGRARPLAFGIVMAGGKGTRLWPWSRNQRPKYLLKLLAGPSLIQQTVDRLAGVFSTQHIFVVTDRNQQGPIAQEVPALPRDNFILEPLSRNTAACAGLAAIRLGELCPDAVLVLAPADHYVEGEEKFAEAINAAVRAAEKKDALVLVGVKPTRPESGYGYLRLGARCEGSEGDHVFNLKGFVEKPDARRAAAFLETGHYLWNSGLVVGRVPVLLEAFKNHLPQLHAGLVKIGKGLGRPGEDETLEKVYQDSPDISLDYGILEKADNVVAVKADFGWSDIGTWASVKELLGPEADKKRVALDTEDCLILSGNKLVASLGVKGLVVVDTEDCLLICNKERSQEVKLLVKELEKVGLKEYL